MLTVTATEFARNFRGMMDRVEFKRESLIVIRNHHEVARVLPGPATMTAMEAMSDLYRTLPEDAAANWLSDAREGSEGTIGDEERDPWES